MASAATGSDIPSSIANTPWQNNTPRNAEGSQSRNDGDRDASVPEGGGGEGEGRRQRNIIIIGAGIIGLSTAFYLSSHHPELSADVTVVDSSPELFACASGRAGGFLAKDWFVPATTSLGELSFRLHRKVAEEHNGRSKWEYVGSTSFSFVSSSNKKEEKGERVRGDDWLRAGTSRVDAAGDIFDAETGHVVPRWLKMDSAEVERSSTRETTAQIDPHQFCQFLLETVRKRGVVVRNPSTPLRTVLSAEGKLTGLVVTDRSGGEEEEEEVTLPCSHILISSGPWSGRVFQTLFPTSSYQLPISSLAGHSIILRSSKYPPHDLSKDANPSDCHAIFASVHSISWHPEVFSRLNGEIYLAGFNSSTIPLPEVATDVKEQPEDIKNVISAAKFVIQHDSSDQSSSSATSSDKYEIVRTGLCHRPVTPGGVPIIARVPHTKLGDVKTEDNGGVFVAAGHGPWGISLSLGTGKVMSELMMNEITSANVSDLGLQ